MPPGGLEFVYIAQGVQREPSNQTNLKDDVDAILEGGGGSCWKLTSKGPPTRPGSTMVGPAGPTWQPLGVCLGGLPPGVL
jgi:hypothetical protein